MNFEICRDAFSRTTQIDYLSKRENSKSERNIQKVVFVKCTVLSLHRTKWKYYCSNLLLQIQIFSCFSIRFVEVEILCETFYVYA